MDIDVTNQADVNGSSGDLMEKSLSESVDAVKSVDNFKRLVTTTVLSVLTALTTVSAVAQEAWFYGTCIASTWDMTNFPSRQQWENEAAASGACGVPGNSTVNSVATDNDSQTAVQNTGTLVYPNYWGFAENLVQISYTTESIGCTVPTEYNGVAIEGWTLVISDNAVDQIQVIPSDALFAKYGWLSTDGRYVNLDGPNALDRETGNIVPWRDVPGLQWTSGRLISIIAVRSSLNIVDIYGAISHEVVGEMCNDSDNIGEMARFAINMIIGGTRDYNMYARYAPRRLDSRRNYGNANGSAVGVLSPDAFNRFVELFYPS